MQDTVSLTTDILYTFTGSAGILLQLLSFITLMTRYCSNRRELLTKMSLYWTGLEICI